MPNAAHRYFAELEQDYDVHVITQNIDDLHERAGSSSVLHLHGEIRKAQSSKDAGLVYPIAEMKLKWIVFASWDLPCGRMWFWFGEAVPNMVPAAKLWRKPMCLLWRVHRCKYTRRRIYCITVSRAVKS